MRSQHGVLRSMGNAFLSAVLACGLMPAFSTSTAWADPDTATSKDFTQADFAALGLSVSEDIGAESQAPYSTTSSISLLSHAEVYTAANGAHGNQYVIRDGLDRLCCRSSHDDTHLTDKYGSIYGGGGFWSDINRFENSKLENDGNYGGGTESGLSSNSDSNVIAQAGEDFAGIYAKSVEFSDTRGSLGKKDCVAELRAFGDTSTTSIDGTTYKGAVAVDLMSVSASGSRSHLITLYPTVTAGQVYNGGFAYLDGGYVQCLESYFDIEAADVDADGVDEIFVYCGAYRDQSGTRYAVVNMFKKNQSNSWQCQEYQLDCGSASDFSTKSLTSNCQGDFYMQNSPVVTFGSGDIDRNGAQDVAITCSASYGHTNVAFGNCQLFTWNAETSRMTQVDGLPLGGNSSISLAADGNAMVSANCAFGTFEAYGEDGLPNGRTVEGLIIAGYESLGNTYTYSKENYLTKMAYRFLYYDNELGAYQLSDYVSTELELDGNRISYSAAKDTDQGGRYCCTLAPLALCCANLTGVTADGVHNDAILMGGDIFRDFVCSTTSSKSGLGASSGSLFICSEHYDRSDSRHIKGSEQVWIGDVVAGCIGSNGSNDTVDYYNNFKESFIAVVGNHRDEDLREGDDYYWMDLSHYTLNEDGFGWSAEEEVISESNRKNSTYGTWISLCLPDIDEDAVVMKFNSAEKTYTNPQVLAVLQDAPYYQDLQDAFDYLVLGGTGFGSGSSSTASNGFSIDGSLGYAAEVEAGFIAGGRVTFEIGAQASYEYEHASTISYSASFESHAGEGDKAVIYTLPVVYYFYDIFDQSTGKTGQVALPVSLGCETSAVSLEALDKVCASHGVKGAGEYLTNTSGAPSTYEDNSSSTDSFGYGKEGVSRVYTGEDWMGCNSNAGASITQEIEVESEDSHTVETGLCISGDILGGSKCFGQKAFIGAAGDIAAGHARARISSNSVSFEGCVDNLPEEAGTDYGFQWRLGVNLLSLEDFTDKPITSVSGNMDNFWIIGYETKGTQQPLAPAVTGLTARAATDTSVTLSWNEPTQDSASAYRYGIGMLANTSTDDYPIISSWKYADKGTTSLEWSELQPGTSYRFVMYLVDENGMPQSIKTPVVRASTLPDGWSFNVQGVDTQSATPLSARYSATAAEGDSLTLAATGTLTRSGANDANLTFTWFKKERGAENWETVSVTTATSPTQVSTLNLDAVSGEDDGAQYYCMVSYNDYALDTNAIRLSVESTPIQPVAQSTANAHVKLHTFISLWANSFKPRASAEPVVALDVVNPESGVQPQNGQTNGGSTGGSALSATEDALLGWQFIVTIIAFAALLLTIAIVNSRRNRK